MWQAARSFIFLSLEKREWGLQLGVSTRFHSLVFMRQQKAEDSLEEVKQKISKRFLKEKIKKQQQQKTHTHRKKENKKHREKQNSNS